MAALKNSIASELPSCWTSPPKCIINFAELLENAKSYDGLLEEAQELPIFEKKMMSVFVVDKHTRKISHSTKDIVIRSLISLGFKHQNVVKVTDFSCGAYCYPQRKIV